MSTGIENFVELNASLRTQQYSAKMCKLNPCSVPTEKYDNGPKEKYLGVISSDKL